MDLKVIKTRKQFREYLAEVNRLMDIDPPEGSEDDDRLEHLILLVHAYEEKHFHFDLPTPVEAILFRMEQQGLTRRDLIPYLGSASGVSEVLSGKRSLSLAMIRKLHKGLGIPLEALVAEQKAA